MSLVVNGREMKKLQLLNITGISPNLGMSLAYNIDWKTLR